MVTFLLMKMSEAGALKLTLQFAIECITGDGYEPTNNLAITINIFSLEVIVVTVSF